MAFQHYRGYFSPAWFALGVWFLMTVALAVCLLKFYSPCPYQDDYFLLAEGTSWSSLMMPHECHRFPMVKILAWTSQKIFGDLWFLCYCSAAACSLASLFFLYALKKYRGNLEWTDAVIPLIMMHGGHSINLYWAVQLFFIAAGCLACVMIPLALDTREKKSVGWSLFAGMVLLLLPMHGAMGLLFAPFFGLAIFFQGVSLWKTDRKNGVIRVVFPILASGMCLLYLVGLSSSQVEGSSAPLGLRIQTILGTAAQGFGYLGNRFQTPVGLLDVFLTLGVVGGFVYLWRNKRVSGMETFSMVCILAACWLPVVSIGHGRATLGTATRYAIFAAPLVCAIYLGWVLLEKRGTAAFSNMAKFMQVCLFVLFCSMGVNHLTELYWHGCNVETQTGRFVGDLNDSEMPLEVACARNYAFWSLENEDEFTKTVVKLREDGVPLFQNVKTLKEMDWKGRSLPKERWEKQEDGSYWFVLEKPQKVRLAAVDFSVKADDVPITCRGRWTAAGDLRPIPDVYEQSCPSRYHRETRKTAYFWIGRNIDRFQFIPNDGPCEVEIHSVTLYRTP